MGKLSALINSADLSLREGSNESNFIFTSNSAAVATFLILSANLYFMSMRLIWCDCSGVLA
jgi:hypothetical protein